MGLSEVTVLLFLVYSLFVTAAQQNGAHFNIAESYSKASNGRSAMKQIAEAKQKLYSKTTDPFANNENSKKEEPDATELIVNNNTKQQEIYKDKSVMRIIRNSGKGNNEERRQIRDMTLNTETNQNYPRQEDAYLQTSFPLVPRLPPLNHIQNQLIPKKPLAPVLHKFINTKGLLIPRPLRPKTVSPPKNFLLPKFHSALLGSSQNSHLEGNPEDQENSSEFILLQLLSPNGNGHDDDFKNALLTKVTIYNVTKVLDLNKKTKFKLEKSDNFTIGMSYMDSDEEETEYSNTHISRLQKVLGPEVFEEESTEEDDTEDNAQDENQNSITDPVILRESNDETPNSDGSKGLPFNSGLYLDGPSEFVGGTYVGNGLSNSEYSGKTDYNDFLGQPNDMNNIHPTPLLPEMTITDFTNEIEKLILETSYDDGPTTRPLLDLEANNYQPENPEERTSDKYTSLGSLLLSNKNEIATMRYSESQLVHDISQNEDLTKPDTELLLKELNTVSHSEDKIKNSLNPPPLTVKHGNSIVLGDSENELVTNINGTEIKDEIYAGNNENLSSQETSPQRKTININNSEEDQTSIEKVTTKFKPENGVGKNDPNQPITEDVYDENQSSEEEDNSEEPDPNILKSILVVDEKPENFGSGSGNPTVFIDYEQTEVTEPSIINNVIAKITKEPNSKDLIKNTQETKDKTVEDDDSTSKILLSENSSEIDSQETLPARSKINENYDNNKSGEGKNEESYLNKENAMGMEPKTERFLKEESRTTPLDYSGTESKNLGSIIDKVKDLHTDKISQESTEYVNEPNSEENTPAQKIGNSDLNESSEETFDKFKTTQNDDNESFSNKPKEDLKTIISSRVPSEKNLPTTELFYKMTGTMKPINAGDLSTEAKTLKDKPSYEVKQETIDNVDAIRGEYSNVNLNKLKPEDYDEEGIKLESILDNEVIKDHTPTHSVELYAGINHSKENPSKTTESVASPFSEESIKSDESTEEYLTELCFPVTNENEVPLIDILSGSLFLENNGKKIKLKLKDNPLKNCNSGTKKCKLPIEFNNYESPLEEKDSTSDGVDEPDEYVQAVRVNKRDIDGNNRLVGSKKEKIIGSSEKPEVSNSAGNNVKYPSGNPLRNKMCLVNVLMNILTNKTCSNSVNGNSCSHVSKDSIKTTKTELDEKKFTTIPSKDESQTKLILLRLLKVLAENKNTQDSSWNSKLPEGVQDPNKRRLKRTILQQKDNNKSGGCGCGSMLGRTLPPIPNYDHFVGKRLDIITNIAHAIKDIAISSG